MASDVNVCALLSSLPLTCGTHFGLTKLPASMAHTPASCNRRMSSTLVSTETADFSFCKPSRGETSTILTKGAPRSAAPGSDSGEAAARLRRGAVRAAPTGRRELDAAAARRAPLPSRPDMVPRLEVGVEVLDQEA